VQGPIDTGDGQVGEVLGAHAGSSVYVREQAREMGRGDAVADEEAGAVHEVA